MGAVTKQVRIVNKYGLHARPAMQLVETANRFGCKIEISNDSLTVDAKSIMSVMRLAATCGTMLQITADGQDAEQAAIAMESLIQEGFGEMEPSPEAELDGKE